MTIKYILLLTKHDTDYFYNHINQIFKIYYNMHFFVFYCNDKGQNDFNMLQSKITTKEEFNELYEFLRELIPELKQEYHG